MRFNDIAALHNEGRVIHPGPCGFARAGSAAAGRGDGAWRLRRRWRQCRQFLCDGAGSGATVAFESIDGPPPQVFDRMVGVLDSESKLRSLSVVSREGTAAYRVRSYLSAQVVRGKTVIAWVWDVYDANQQRALRLSGEELTSAKAGRDATRDAWAAADDLVLRKIAQAGFSGLSNMINGSPETPGLRGPAMASVIQQAPAAEMPASALGYAAR